MKTFQSLAPMLAGVLYAAVATAGGIAVESLDIDFTNTADAKSKATWLEADPLTANDDGFGWDGDPESRHAGWIQSAPLPVGRSWRPTSNARVLVRVNLKPDDVVLSEGQTASPYPGNMFVRYSPDGLHWSTWQLLPVTTADDSTKKPESGRRFRGDIAIPNSEKQRYQQFLKEYQRLDVPWPSDEDAAVRWILKNEPQFFAKQLPFIGYVQIRYEVDLIGGQRIQSVNAEAVWTSSGMVAPPKKGFDELHERSSKPWSFKAESPTKQAEPGVGADSR